MRLTNIYLITALAISFTSQPLRAEEEGGSAKIGPDQAITMFDPEKGIQLSDLAIKNIGIKTQSLLNSTAIQVPISSLVYFQDDVGVYRLRDQWFNLVKVQVLSKTAREAQLKTSDIGSKDQVVTQGTALLRVAHLEASEGEGNGHDD